LIVQRSQRTFRSWSQRSTRSAVGGTLQPIKRDPIDDVDIFFGCSPCRTVFERFDDGTERQLTDGLEKALEVAISSASWSTALIA
jgi:hypothetical protein